MAINPIPAGHHTITPYLFVQDAGALIAFLKQAFNATEKHRTTTPDGRIAHAQVIIGDSPVMLGEAQGEWKAMPAALYLYVPDSDALYRQAMSAGAKSLSEPSDMFYGDRVGAIIDPAGNMWWMATHKEDVSAEELLKRHAAATAEKQKK